MSSIFALAWREVCTEVEQQQHSPRKGKNPECLHCRDAQKALKNDRDSSLPCCQFVQLLHRGSEATLRVILIEDGVPMQQLQSLESGTLASEILAGVRLGNVSSPKVNEKQRYSEP